MATAFRPKHLLPNAVTAASLVLGYLVILAAAEGQFGRAAVLCFAAALCDTLDGRLARLLDAGTAFGGELDSLCDASSFGVAPAVLIYFAALKPLGLLGTVVAVIYLCAGVGRLARFNLDKSKKPHFQGLPIPAGAAYVISFVLIRDVVSPWWIAVGVVIIALLMISSVKVPSLAGGRESLPLWLMPIGIGLFAVFIYRSSAWTWHAWNTFNLAVLAANYVHSHRLARRPPPELPAQAAG